jgi:DNA-binding response OmpR family regulator
VRLLLVEDDPVLGPELQQSFARRGYAVDLVSDGMHAEELGSREPYDAVVLDLGLPRRSGLEVLRAWRAAGNRVPVVILTARGSWQEKVEGFQAGTDDYVGKPFQFQELDARVEAVVRRAQGAVAGVPLNVDSMVLDEAACCLRTASGESVPLTAVEFRLLRYLVRHPGQVFSKEQLAEHVYDFDQVRDSNVIEVYVNRLRQKIGRERIVTRRGLGYVFAPRD